MEGNALEDAELNVLQSRVSSGDVLSLFRIALSFQLVVPSLVLPSISNIFHVACDELRA